MRGIYQHCKEKHLHRYLAEFDFRYNYRIALGYSDIDRTKPRSKALNASGFSINNLVAPTFRFKATRFLRWRKKRRKSKGRA
jgi:hypothetical protein